MHACMHGCMDVCVYVLQQYKEAIKFEAVATVGDRDDADADDSDDDDQENDYDDGKR